MSSEDRPANRWDRKKSKTRSDLLLAAVQLASERGADHVTVEDISDAADVSPRTFFNYFASKDDAITGHDPDRNARFIESLLAAPKNLSVLDAARLACVTEFGRIEDERELWTLRMAAIMKSPTLLAKLISSGSADELALAEAIATRTGSSVEADSFPRLAAALVSAALRVAVGRWCALDGSHTLPELIDESIASLRAGLPDPPTSPAATSNQKVDS